MKKRIAAILAIAATAVIGASSSASAAGDPLWVDTYLSSLCPTPNPGGSCPPLPHPLLSVEQLLGPNLGNTVCTPKSQLIIPLSYADVVICKQP